MTADPALLPGRIMRRAAPAVAFAKRQDIQIDDPRLAEVLAPDAPLWCLYESAVHGEGPVWQHAANRLLWSDVTNRRLLAWYPDGRVEVVIDATYFINGNALDALGNLIHCEHGRRCISLSRVGTVDGAQPEPLITHYRGRRLNSPNDVTVAADGAIWFTDPTFGILVPSQGSLAEPELEHRSVYRFDPATQDLRRMADFEQPNGVALSPDGRRLYISDTSLALREIAGAPDGAKHEIVAFDVAADGALAHRRVFFQTDHGCPDGFVVDARGWLWTTAADGVHICTTTGDRLGFIPLPAVATNCTLGGSSGRRLFITATEYLFALDLNA